MAGPSVLNALDKARTQWYHFTAIIIAGMGFFTDAYDLFVISTVTKLLGRLYYFDPSSSKPGALPINVNLAVTSVALWGTLAGQLFFGWLGDKLGRKKVYGVTLLLMIICSVGSSMSFGHSATAVMTTLCFWRFWLGFGIGGDYPLSATIMSEYANTKTRGAFIAAVFAMQGIGILAAASLSIIVAVCFRAEYNRPAYAVDPIASTPPQSDYVWRILVALGAAPAAATFYYRMRMPETARYTALVEGNAAQAASDMTQVLEVKFAAEDAQVVHIDKYGLFSRKFLQRHGTQLFGCASTWLLLDIAFYSQNLFQKDVFSAVGWIPPAKTMSALTEIYKIARAQALIALCSTVPGYWVTVATIDILGRWFIQLQGFFFMTLFMTILAANYPHFKGKTCADRPGYLCGGNHTAFIVLYGFTFFFANFGPNATTFIIPAELFPARLRSTCHGISAASGKAGAIIGAMGFLYASQSPHKTSVDAGYPTGIGIQWSLALLAISNFLGFLCTFFVPETKRRSLEDLSGEQADYDEAHAANGGVMPPGKLVAAEA
eukprot:SM000066S20457  [mRNA]  locus=s66:460019:463029:- [translate_table: standard]